MCHIGYNVHGKNVGFRSKGEAMANIVQDKQGAYRWVYEFNLFTNPTILFTVLKILLGIVGAGVLVLLISMIPDLANGSASADDVWDAVRFGGFFVLLFLVLACVGYVAYALMQGGKYCVVFTMDERGITHEQLPKQYKKAQVVSALNVVAGIATGNPTQVGIGITSGRNALSSDFSAVRSIKGSRALRTIKVNEPLAKNQVYVEAEDYDFVFDFIVSHCPNATVR